MDYVGDAATPDFNPLRELEPLAEGQNLDSFFELHPDADEELRRYLKKRNLPEGGDSPEGFAKVLGQLKGISENCDWDSQTFTSDDAVQDYLLATMDDLDGMSVLIKGWIEQGILSQADFRQLCEVQAWLFPTQTDEGMKGSFFADAFWRREVNTPGSPKKAPGNANLMHYIVSINRTLEEKGSLLALKDAGIPLADVLCCCAPHARAVFLRSRKAADMVAALEPKPRNVVELACGDGEVTDRALTALSGAVSNRVADIVGIHLMDIDEAILTSAKARIEALLARLEGTGTVSAHVVDANSADFLEAIDDDSVDVFKSIGLADYFDEIQIEYIFAQVFKKLRPGGTAIFGVFKENFPYNAVLEILMRWGIKGRMPLWLKELAHRLGFKGVKVVELPSELGDQYNCQLIIEMQKPV